jgi:hypothetical protein
MSNREAIVSSVVTQLTALTECRTVTREPRALEELSKSSFPHILVETANETRSTASFGAEVRRVSELEILLNVVVHGADRDQKRNTVIAAIETKLSLDPTFGGLCYNSEITEISIREIAESAPYGQAAVLLRVEYFYTRGTP